MRAHTLWNAIAIAVLGAAASLAPLPARAQAASVPAATVYLKNGGLVRGELIELQPGTIARIKLADGTVREIPWAQVDHVDDPSLPPAPPPGSAAAAQPAPASAAPASNPNLMPAATGASEGDEVKRLRAERDEINNTVPVVMMIVGGGAFLVFGVPGIALLAVGQVCDDSNLQSTTEQDCVNLRGAGVLMTVIGVAGAAVAVWGLVKLGDNRERRNALDARIRELKGEPSLSFDLVPREKGLSLGLTLRM